MSTIQLSAYINFQGHAREAMEFYQQALGGDLILQTVDEQGQARPTNSGDRITHARLEADGVSIIGSDGHPSYPPAVGDNLALAVGGSDTERLTAIFNALAAGGKIKAPLTAQSGGTEVGWLTDQFGVNWMIRIEKA